MSMPPPSAGPAQVGPREQLLVLEPSGSRLRRATGALRLGPSGALITHTRTLSASLTLPLGTLQLGLVDPGPARVSGAAGRFPVLRRLSATAVLPREHGIEGWLWTSTGGSALTVVGDEDDAPNVALVFTKPLDERAVGAFAPDAAAAIAARSPLGAPTVHGLLLRVADTATAERTFRQYGLLRPLTDREVPPTLRRSLPTDRAADPRVRGAELEAAAASVAPPGMG